MKFLLSLSFLLFAAASSINASSFFDEGPPVPIFDVYDAQLQFGVPYYMLSQPGWGSGFSLPGATPSEPCPKVIQANLFDRTDRGTPVVFSSADESVTGNISSTSKFIISFYNLTRPNEEVCGGSNSTIWGLANVEVGGPTTLHVEVGGLPRGGLEFMFLTIPYPEFKSYLLSGPWAEEMHFAFMIDDSGKLITTNGILESTHVMVVFQKAESTEEDEDEKPVIIQMPRKMSV